ncbi:MAG: hypothetical protein IT343_10695 [Candidatus Melainabacteria bacterium]|nr:hypothetical protein [Candidatus Melainabacteria bacterium]
MTQILSPEEFADLAAERMVEPIADGDLSLDRERFALIIKSGNGKPLQMVRLSRFYETYAQNPNSLDDVLRRVGQVARDQPNINDFQSIAPNLMPAIRDRADVFFEWFAARREIGDAAGDLRGLVFADHFIIYPVLDTGGRLGSIPSQVMDSWDIDFEGIMEIAVQNLVAATPHTSFSSLVNTESNTAEMHESTWSDNYDSVRSCYFDFPELDVPGEKLYLMLDTSRLYIWGSQSEIGTAYVLAELDKAAEESERTDRRLPPYVFHRDATGGLAIYHPHPEKEAALHNALQRHQVIYRSLIYERQREFLSSDADIQEQDIYVGKYGAFQRPDGQIYTACTWTEGAEILLPKTDTIMFAKNMGDGAQFEMAAEVPWEKVVEIMGDQLVEVNLYPKRFKTVGWPSDEQMVLLKRFKL